MARKLKTPAEAAAKFARRVQGAGQDYQSGVQSATDWAANAVAAAPRRNAGLQAAIANGTIDAGIQRAGDAKWRANTLSKGVQNWATNTAKAQDAYQSGMTRAMAYQQQAQAATASIDTTTLEGRLEKARVYAQTVHAAAQADKRGR
jgi:hypothetical protein